MKKLIFDTTLISVVKSRVIDGVYIYCCAQ